MEVPVNDWLASVKRQYFMWRAKLLTLGLRDKRKQKAPVSQSPLYEYTLSVKTLLLPPPPIPSCTVLSCLYDLRCLMSFNHYISWAQKWLKAVGKCSCLFWWQGGRWIVTLRSFFFSQLLKHMDCFTLWVCSVNKWVCMCWGISLVS